MITRYDLMNESTATDIDNDSFPDILSINYKEVLESNEFIVPPLQIDIDEMFINKPYLFIYTYYSNKPEVTIMDSKGQVYLDDIILDINNVKHRDALVDGDRILFPDANELQTFISSRIKNR